MSIEISGVTVKGYFDQKFSPTVEKFAQNISSGEDVGASFALSQDGEVVVDIWGGHLDEALTSPWLENSIVNVWSSTKTATFLCAPVLADRRLLDFDENVAFYWPEFAANGKSAIKIWHLMNHAAGLSGIDVPIDTTDHYDWQKMTGVLAAQRPWWEPGSASGDHALTQGWLIGEVVRRVTGQSIGEFLRREVAGPLGAESVMIPRIDGTDLVLNVPVTFGLGFALNRGAIPLSPNVNTCYWGGWGGSSVIVDQDAKVAMSYVMNRMFPGLLGDTRGYLLRQQAYQDLGMH